MRSTPFGTTWRAASELRIWCSTKPGNSERIWIDTAVAELVDLLQQLGLLQHELLAEPAERMPSFS